MALASQYWFSSGVVVCHSKKVSQLYTKVFDITIDCMFLWINMLQSTDYKYPEKLDEKLPVPVLLPEISCFLNMMINISRLLTV